MKADPKKIILAGGSGFLGRALAKDFVEEGHDAVILTRNPEMYRGPGRAVHWTGSGLGGWSAELNGAGALVNLTGKNVNCRPTPRNRDEILRSRVDSVRTLGEAIRETEFPPPVWVQASSLAIYGDAGDRLCDEDAPAAGGYPANVCTAWEAAFDESLLPGIRGVVLRIGFVLGSEDGALPFLSRLTRFGLGGAIGNGRQWISWIHRDDMVRLFREVIDDPDRRGILNATGPQPVTNAGFMRALRRVHRRSWSLPAPAPAVRLGAWMLDSDPQIALTGRRCISSRLEEAGFEFRYPELESALANLYPNHAKKL